MNRPSRILSTAAVLAGLIACSAQRQDHLGGPAPTLLQSPQLTAPISPPSAGPAASVISNSGPGDAGGGNARTSSKEDLQEVVDNIGHILNVHVDWAIPLTSTPLKPELLPIAEKIFGKGYFYLSRELSDYIARLKYEIVDEPCYEGKIQKDASTKHERNSPICLSASRLSRFPKTTLRQVLLPIIIHEVAHQFGFKEEWEADAMQAIADIHLKYQRVFLTAMRAWMMCSFVSVGTTESQRKEVRDFQSKYFNSGEPVPENLHSLYQNGDSRDQSLANCAANSRATSEGLEQTYNGRWGTLPSGLRADEEQVLNKYNGYKDFHFGSIKFALYEPTVTGIQICKHCGYEKADGPYLMMLGAKSALALIDREVARLQKNIPTQNHRHKH